MDKDTTPKHKTRADRPRGGRPTKQQQQQRHDLLLSVALDVFLEHGFEQATVDQIVGVIGMSKRTVYAHYKDKSALLKAALHRAVEVYTISYEQVAALIQEDLIATLTDVALMRIRNATTPEAIRLQRILSAQAYRFPELAHAVLMQGVEPTIALLTDLIRKRAPAGSSGAAEPRRAAVAFMSLAASGPVRLSVLGHVLDETELRAGVDYNVRLFLKGSGLEGGGEHRR